ncbi:MAG: membrane protein insertion efficiency factor YidD [Acidobacteria bacterium]|nr:membrane protein insertion efficiency factor YidD [Acidobacteriota bacterium]
MNWGQKIVVFLLLFYKTQLSPFLPSACKYQPTCSMYAKEVVERFGVLKGLWLTTLRLLRCNPFARGGYDPAPDA